jgi:glucose/arabinose dehydrogenase
VTAPTKEATVRYRQRTCRVLSIPRSKRAFYAAVAVGVGVGLVAGPRPVGATTTLTTTRVASGLTRPVFVTSPPGDDRLFIVEQRGADNRGRIKILKNGAVLARAFLTTAVLPSGNEQGLYSMAFAPDYATSGRFYIHYTDNSNTNRVARYTVSGDPDSANATGMILYSAPQPFTNHKGGWMAFGPDGYLWVALGDGGSASDPGDRALNINVPLGKLLRFDVSGAAAVPAPDNPFAGATPGLDEIFAYGLRNPWRASIDRLTGDLIIGDVGQNVWEEIDFAPADSARGKGWNWGWRCYEANAAHASSATIPCGTCLQVPACAFRFPAHAFDHTLGRCSVTGGYVYRGCAIPDLQGTYFFADYCGNQIYTGRFVNNMLTGVVNRAVELDPPGTLAIGTITSFGEDSRGELYICDQGGEVFKVIPRAPGVAEADMPSVQVQTLLGTLGATTPGNALAPGITPFERPGSRISGVGYLRNAAIRACPETVQSSHAVTTFNTFTTLGPWNIDMSAAVDTDASTLTRTFVFTNVSGAQQPLDFVDVVAPWLNSDDDVARQYSFASPPSTVQLVTSEESHAELFVTLQGSALGATFGSDVDSLTNLEARVANDFPLLNRTQVGPTRCAMALSFGFGVVDANDSRTATVVVRLLDMKPVTDSGDDITTLSAPELRALGPVPFRDALPLSYGLPRTGRAQIDVYDVRGRRVRRLVDSHDNAGLHRTTWDGLDDGGRPLGAGIYFVRLRTPAGERSLRVVRMR